MRHLELMWPRPSMQTPCSDLMRLLQHDHLIRTIRWNIVRLFRRFSKLQVDRRQHPFPLWCPVGVLKREGAPPKTARKEVMFSDGIRPGCDLTELDNSWTPTRSGSSDGNGNVRKSTNRRVQTPPGSSLQLTYSTGSFIFNHNTLTLYFNTRRFTDAARCQGPQKAEK